MASSSLSSVEKGEASAPNNLATVMKSIPWGHSLMGVVRNYLEQHGKVAFDEGDEKGMTPLMIACLFSNKEVVEYLRELGAGLCNETK